MNWVITLYIALLFFVLTPGVLVSLPPKRGKFVVAAVHALIFAGIWHFTYKFVWNASMSMMAPPPAKKEGAANMADAKKQPVDAPADPAAAALAAFEQAKKEAAANTKM